MKNIFKTFPVSALITLAFNCPIIFSSAPATVAKSIVAKQKIMCTHCSTQFLFEGQYLIHVLRRHLHIDGNNLPRGGAKEYAKQHNLDLAEFGLPNYSQEKSQKDTSEKSTDKSSQLLAQKKTNAQLRALKKLKRKIVESKHKKESNIQSKSDNESSVSERENIDPRSSSRDESQSGNDSESSSNSNYKRAKLTSEQHQRKDKNAHRDPSQEILMSEDLNLIARDPLTGSFLYCAERLNLLKEAIHAEMERIKIKFIEMGINIEQLMPKASTEN